MQQNKAFFATPEERVQMLRMGIPGNDIETLYVHMNKITVLGVNWQDSHEIGTVSVTPNSTTTTIPTSRHASSPVSAEV